MSKGARFVGFLASFTSHILQVLHVCMSFGHAFIPKNNLYLLSDVRCWQVWNPYSYFSFFPLPFRLTLQRNLTATGSSSSLREKKEDANPEMMLSDVT